MQSGVVGIPNDNLTMGHELNPLPAPHPFQLSPETGVLVCFCL